MLLFKKLTGGKYCIIEDQNVILFDKTGKYISSDLSITPEYLNGALKMNYVSILSSGKRLEVGVFINDTLTKYLSSLNPQDCVMTAFANLKPICFLRRNGSQDNINYNQAIFVCNSTYTGEGLVDLLKLSKVEE